MLNLQLFVLNVIIFTTTFIAYLNITMLIYEQVFRLQVSVDEVQGVKVLKGEYYLSCIKSCMVFTERRWCGQPDTQ